MFDKTQSLKPDHSEPLHPDPDLIVGDKQLVHAYTNLLCGALKTIQICRSLDKSLLPAIINGQYTTVEHLAEAFQFANKTRIGARKMLVMAGLSPDAIYSIERDYLVAGITEPIVIGALE